MISNVNGVDMLTGIYAKGQCEVILDTHYEVHKLLTVEEGSSVNAHAFNTVENGIRFLALTLQWPDASGEEVASIGYTGQCDVHYPGIRSGTPTLGK